MSGIGNSHFIERERSSPNFKGDFNSCCCFIRFYNLSRCDCYKLTKTNNMDYLDNIYRDGCPWFFPLYRSFDVCIRSYITYICYKYNCVRYNRTGISFRDVSYNSVSILVFIPRSQFYLTSCCRWLLKIGPYVEPKQPVAIACDECSTLPVTPKTSCTCSPRIVLIDKANQFPDKDFQLSDKAIQCPCKAFLRKGKFTCTRECVGRKFPPPKVTSHGGTFHVSKDVVPILNPYSPTHR